MTDFSSMTRPELSVWYIETVGYDLGEEDKEMTLQEYREICAELEFLHMGGEK